MYKFGKVLKKYRFSNIFWDMTVFSALTLLFACRSLKSGFPTYTKDYIFEMSNERAIR